MRVTLTLGTNVFAVFCTDGNNLWHMHTFTISVYYLKVPTFHKICKKICFCVSVCVCYVYVYIHCKKLFY